MLFPENVPVTAQHTLLSEVVARQAPVSRRRSLPRPRRTLELRHNEPAATLRRWRTAHVCTMAGTCAVVHTRGSPGRVESIVSSCTTEGHMKPIAIIGLVLIVVGLAALAYQGVTYTSRETVLDIGPIHATADRERTLPLPPVLGILAVASGVGLLLAGLRKSGSVALKS